MSSLEKGNRNINAADGGKPARHGETLRLRATGLTPISTPDSEHEGECVSRSVNVF